MSKTYFPVIGLEIHAELNTVSKMFCGCKNDADEVVPNKNICPVCMAHPGTLPVPNKRAIESVIKVGLAVNGSIANSTEFDRKNYFYPDIPKGYQISQYKHPIVSGGSLHGVHITRIHLEEDTGTSKHDKGEYTHLDFNRAGVPLMELVTEPVITSGAQASTFAKELQLLLRYLGVSHANMEKGEMRVEANISVSSDKDTFGTKVEVKNLNSFRSVEKAIAYEIERMSALLEAGRGDEIVQETRGWDEMRQSTFSQRSKENAQDYRYFPDPDIAKMNLHSAFDLDMMQSSLPELPDAKRARYEAMGIKKDAVEVYVGDMALSNYIERFFETKNTELISIASNYLLSDVVGIIKKEPTLSLPSYEHFFELVEMVHAGDVTSRGAKDILAHIMKNPSSPKAYATEHGLIQQHDEGALKEHIARVIEQHEKIVADYRGGKEAALQALVGMVMKETKGSANPGVALKMLKEML